MSNQGTEIEQSEQSPQAPAVAPDVAAAATAKKPRPLAGFIIAGASLALLFGIAALKGRVKDNDPDMED